MTPHALALAGRADAKDGRTRAEITSAAGASAAAPAFALALLRPPRARPAFVPRAHSPAHFPHTPSHLTAGPKTRAVSYGFLQSPYPSTHPECGHDLGGLEISGQEKVSASGAQYVSSLYVTCRSCTRMVSGKPKKGRKITLHDKVRLTAAQQMVAVSGFPKKDKGGGGGSGGGGGGGGR